MMPCWGYLQEHPKKTHALLMHALPQLLQTAFNAFLDLGWLSRRSFSGHWDPSVMLFGCQLTYMAGATALGN
jgi:hypothetical protein